MSPIVERLIVKLAEREARRLAAKLGSDQPNVGHWEGRFKLTPHKNGKKYYLFENNETDPLRFVHDAGFAFRPKDSFITDLGSIPWVFHGFPRKYLRLRPNDFPEAYILHDSACENGWIWCWNVARHGPWQQIKMTKKQADVLLFWCLTAKSLTTGNEPTRAECQAVYRAVRLFHTFAK